MKIVRQSKAMLLQYFAQTLQGENNVYVARTR